MSKNDFVLLREDISEECWFWFPLYGQKLKPLIWAKTVCTNILENLFSQIEVWNDVSVVNDDRFHFGVGYPLKALEYNPHVFFERTVNMLCTYIVIKYLIIFIIYNLFSSLSNICIYIYVCVYIWSRVTHTHTHTYIYIYIYIYSKCISKL